MKTYTCEEAAKKFHCSTPHIQRACKSREIPAFKVGRAWIITEEALANYAAAKQNEAEQAAIDERSKQKCQSTAMNLGYGRYPFVHQAVAELDNLLKPKTDKKHKSCTIN